MSDFMDAQTGEFDIQAYDAAMDAYEDEMEEFGNLDYDRGDLDSYFYEDEDDV